MIFYVSSFFTAYCNCEKPTAYKVNGLCIGIIIRSRYLNCCTVFINFICKNLFVFFLFRSIIGNSDPDPSLFQDRRLLFLYSCDGKIINRTFSNNFPRPGRKILLVSLFHFDNHSCIHFFL